MPGALSWSTSGRHDERPILTDFAFAPGSDRVACATRTGLELRTWRGLELVHAWTASSLAWRRVCFHPGGGAWW